MIEQPQEDFSGSFDEHVDAPKSNGKSYKQRRFKLTWLRDIVTNDEISCLIDGLLPSTGLAVVFGPPKSLKSFVLIDALLHVAINKAYCGRDVQAGAIIYITSEGVAGVRRRLIAMRQYHDVEGRDVPFALIAAMPDLGNGTADAELLKTDIVKAIADLTVPVRAIVIDTMRRAIPGKSENDQKDVSAFVANCDTLAKHFNCLVTAVHHSPRSDNTRGSGSNALDAAADAMWQVTRTEGTSRANVTIHAMKDGSSEGDTWAFELVDVLIGTDRSGKPIETCHVEIIQTPEARKSTAKPTKRPKPTATEQRMMDILVRAVDEAGAFVTNTATVPRSTKAITRDMARLYAANAGFWAEDQNEDSRRALLSHYLNKLAGKQVIGLTAEHVWIIPK